jgi:DNA-binding beta-propeller fold protein YncE
MTHSLRRAHGASHLRGRLRLPIWGIFLTVLVLALGGTLAPGDVFPGIASRAGLARTGPMAYTLVAGRVARLDPSTGAILAMGAEQYGDQSPSLAVSRDGRAVYLLHSVVRDGHPSDELLTLNAATLAPVVSAPVDHFLRPMESWPPAMAVTTDDRTVLVSQYGNSDSDPYWISYYDRQSGRFAADTTILPNCGVSQLLPFDDQVAVLCLGSDNLRFVDLRTHRVTATLTPGVTPVGVLGSAVAAGFIPGQRALAVVLDHGGLVRVELDTHAISVLGALVPADGGLHVRWADFSANGRVAAALLRADGSETRPVPIVLADVASGRVLDRLSVDSLYPALTLSPDGQHLFVTAASGAVQVVDLRSHRTSPFGPDPAQMWVHLVFGSG